jgi:hypothetical protein
MFGGLFEIIRRFEQRSLSERLTEKFDSERQAVAREPSRHGHRRISKI